MIIRLVVVLRVGGARWFIPLRAARAARSLRPLAPRASLAPAPLAYAA